MGELGVLVPSTLHRGSFDWLRLNRQAECRDEVIVGTDTERSEPACRVLIDADLVVEQLTRQGPRLGVVREVKAASLEECLEATDEKLLAE